MNIVSINQHKDFKHKFQGFYTGNALLVQDRIKGLAHYWGWEILIDHLMILGYSPLFKSHLNPHLRLLLEQLIEFYTFESLEKDLMDIYGSDENGRISCIGGPEATEQDVFSSKRKQIMQRRRSNG